MRFASLALLMAVAQAPATTPPPADLVRIDAIVTDSRGRRVETLKPADFALREDGTPQEIAGVQLVRNPRLVGIYLDEYFVSAANTSAVRDTLHRFVNALSADDRVVILRPLDSLLTIKLTQDRPALHAAIDAFEGRRGDYTPRTAFERSYVVGDRARADEQRAQSTWSTLNALTLHLGNLGTGRTSVLLVSEQADPVFHRRGFEGLPTSSSVTRAANRSNVSVYVFDPRDAQQRASNPDEGPNLLRVLADDTDGALLLGPETADAGLRAMLADASSYYLLTYRSARSHDGLFHTVDILAKPAGMRVRARRGYWAPTPDEVQRANMVAHANDPPTPMKLLPARHVSRLIRPWFGTSRGDDGKTRVTFVWEPAVVVPGDRHVRTPARVEIKAVGSDGTTAFDGVVGERGSAVFDVPPGRVAVTMSIEDAAANAIDSDVRDIIIRDLKGSGVLLGTPQVFRARTARDVRELSAEAEAVPVAAREFSRTEHLLIRVPAYAPSAPTLTATLISPARQAMRQLQVEPAQNAPAVAQVDVPLAGLVPGQYSVEISAKTPGGVVKEAVVFHVSD